MHTAGPQKQMRVVKVFHKGGVGRCFFNLNVAPASLLALSDPSFSALGEGSWCFNTFWESHVHTLEVWPCFARLSINFLSFVIHLMWRLCPASSPIVEKVGGWLDKQVALNGYLPSITAYQAIRMPPLPSPSLQACAHVVH